MKKDNTLKKNIPPSTFLSEYGSLLLWLLAGVLALGFVFVAVLHPVAQWDRARTTGGQYYTYLTAFNTDLNELEFLNKQYTYVPLRDTVLDRKIPAAANYSSRARQTMTSWNYFRLFIQQNEGPLRKWNVNTTATLGRVDNGQTTVRSTATKMASELEPLMANQSAEIAEGYAGIISELRELAK